MKNSSLSIRSLLAPAAAAGMIALIIVSFILLKEYRPFGQPRQAFPLRNIGIRLQDAELAGRANGKKAWRFRAGVVEVSQDRSTTTFTNIDKGLVYDQERPAIRMSASILTYHSFSKDIVAQGRIRVTANNKVTLATDMLKWSWSGRKLVCPGKVSIDMGAGRGSAGSLEVDLANDTLLLRKVYLRARASEESVKTR